MSITFNNATAFTTQATNSGATSSSNVIGTSSVSAKQLGSYINTITWSSSGNYTYKIPSGTVISTKGQTISVTFINNSTNSSSNSTLTYYGYSLNGNYSEDDLRDYDLYFTTSSGKTIVLTTGTPSSVTVTGETYVAGAPDATVVQCFLAGALIETLSGFKAIEDISMADEIVAYEDKVQVSKSIKAVLKRRVTVRDRMDYPVRFRKDSIAEGIPSTDLLVTSEHCMYFGGYFIPARMLVNGRTITAEDQMQSFDVYHIECEDHEIINASGMLTESFLATSKTYQRSNGASLCSVGTKTWEDDAAAPLTTAMAFVEPLYLQLDKRATDLGYAPREEPKMIQDPDFYLITQKGQVLRPLRVADGSRYVFQLRQDVTSVTLASRTSRPSETIGPFCDDRRELGMLIGDITLFESHTFREIKDHLTAETLPGWDAREASPCRWTNGAAQIDFGTRDPMTSGMLCVQVLSAGPYLADATSAGHLLQKSA